LVEYLPPGDPRIIPLKPRDAVWFSPGWPDAFANKSFQIERCQTLKFDVWKRLDRAATEDVKLTDDEGFLPTRPKSLYEINTVMKGNVLLHPRWPSTDYYWELEKEGFLPDPTDDVKRYIGFVDQDDVPFDQKGGVLKIYTVKDMEPIHLRLYNDSIEAEKAVLRFLINRCLLKEIPKPAVFRAILSYQVMRKEW